MPQMSAELVHDLRLPLQLIQSCAQMIQLAEPGEPTGRYAQMLMDSVEQMRRLLDGALADADVESRRVNADIVRCVRELCLRCLAEAEARGLRLSWGGNAESLVMALDEDMLSRIVLNLISNAMRFTPPGGEIRVEWRALGDFVEISVADSGSGIPVDRLPYVFLRGETDGGHGYGLSSARECARALGGELIAQSCPGAGSQFSARLPVRAARAG